MKLHEYQSKSLFAQHGIPIPQGKVAGTAQEARDIANELGRPVVIKSQVLAGGRGKAGGIRLAKSAQEAEELTAQILNMAVKSLAVRKVLVDEAVNIQQELYLGITVDRAARKPVLIASSIGGMEIEVVARKQPEKIIRQPIDLLLGLRDYQVREVAAGIELPRNLWKAFGQIAAALFAAYIQTDATLAEINPLVITNHHQLLALDGKILLDDNALYRHPALAEMRDPDEEAPLETEARKYGLAYVKLEGEIGCLVNGAGLAMATMDIIQLCGGAPANFLDLGGGASPEKTTAALRIILADPKVKAVLINIFGGLTRCDEVALGILTAMQEINTLIPLVVRLVGTHETEGHRMLADANIITATSLMDAAQKAIAAAKS